MNPGGLSKSCLHIGDAVLFSTPLRNGIGYVYKELSRFVTIHILWFALCKMLNLFLPSVLVTIL